MCKNTKNIQKSDFMDGFCLQGELDLTLFYKIEGYWGIFEKPKSLMTLMTVTLMTGFKGIEKWKWPLMNLTLHDLLKQKAEGMVDIILVKYRAICIFFHNHSCF